MGNSEDEAPLIRVICVIRGSCPVRKLLDFVVKSTVALVHFYVGFFPQGRDPFFLLLLALILDQFVFDGTSNL